MRVLAALSGGVDSAVAAALAVEAGHDVTGVHMALSSEPAACRVGSRGCCSIEDSQDAARAAEIMGIPYYVWDLSEQFEEAVVSDFLAEYRAGHTPNPCVRCNEFVKFRELLERGRALGFDAVCTGHYARIIEGPEGPELHRGLDELKDQSYVLAVMGKEELPHVLLPLGDAPSKAWVREQAEARGLGVSNKPDSYDICFIPDGDTAGFLESHFGKMLGSIVDLEGNILGSHTGHYQFTVGQRKGLRLERPSASGRPRYVLSTDPMTNTVVVGEQELLTVDTITTRDVVWLGEPTSVTVDKNAQEAFGNVLGTRSMNDVPKDVLTVQIRAHGIPSAIADIEVDAVTPDHARGHALDHARGHALDHARGHALDHTSGHALDHARGHALDHTSAEPHSDSASSLPFDTAMAEAALSASASSLSGLSTAPCSPSSPSSVPALPSRPAPAPAPRERLIVRLAKPIRGVAAGQSLVVYRGSRVVAEGTIASASNSKTQPAHDRVLATAALAG